MLESRETSCPECARLRSELAECRTQLDYDIEEERLLAEWEATPGTFSPYDTALLVCQTVRQSGGNARVFENLLPSVPGAPAST